MSENIKSPEGGELLTEHCAECGRATMHTVRLELRTESTKEQNSAFSREPYRVTVCHGCGIERAQRMNNA